MKRILKIAAFTGFAVSLFLPLAYAETAVVANPDPAAVKAGAYIVEPTHTQVIFSVSHLGFTDWYGQFTGITGALSLDPSKPEAAEVSVKIPTAGITTVNAKLDGELKSPDWLDAARYPEIRFTSVKVVKTGPRTAHIAGNLTLHGITRPVVLDARFNAAGINPLDKAYTVGFNAKTKIKRSDFGIKTYLPLVGDEVQITITVAFEPKLD